MHLCCAYHDFGREAGGGFHCSKVCERVFVDAGGDGGSAEIRGSSGTSDASVREPAGCRPLWHHTCHLAKQYRSNLRPCAATNVAGPRSLSQVTFLGANDWQRAAFSHRNEHAWMRSGWFCSLVESFRVIGRLIAHIERDGKPTPCPSIPYFLSRTQVTVVPSLGDHPPAIAVA